MSDEGGEHGGADDPARGQITHWLGRIKVAERVLDAEELEALRTGFAARFRSARIRGIGRTVALALGALSLAWVVFLWRTEPDVVRDNGLTWWFAPYAVCCVAAAVTIVVSDELSVLRGVVLLALVVGVATLVFGPIRVPFELDLAARVIVFLGVPIVTLFAREVDRRFLALRERVDRDLVRGRADVFAAPSDRDLVFEGRNGPIRRARRIELLPESGTLLSFDGRALDVPKVTGRPSATVRREDLTMRAADEVVAYTADGSAMSERPMRADERAAVRRAIRLDAPHGSVMLVMAIGSALGAMSQVMRAFPGMTGISICCVIVVLFALLVSRIRLVRIVVDLVRGRVRVSRDPDAETLRDEVLPVSKLLLADHGVPARWRA